MVISCWSVFIECFFFQMYIFQIKVVLIRQIGFSLFEISTQSISGFLFQFLNKLAANYNYDICTNEASRIGRSVVMYSVWRWMAFFFLSFIGENQMYSTRAVLMFKYKETLADNDSDQTAAECFNLPQYPEIWRKM